MQAISTSQRQEMRVVYDDYLICSTVSFIDFVGEKKSVVTVTHAHQILIAYLFKPILLSLDYSLFHLNLDLLQIAHCRNRSN